MGQLPQDPVNNTSSRLYYTYVTNGSQYETTAAMESAKYKLGGSGDMIGPDGGSLASVYEKGTKLGLEPLDYGDTSLVGLWTFDEGTGSTAYDYSGNNATGSWAGTPSYVGGKVGDWAGSFDGSTDNVTIPYNSAVATTGTYSITAWYVSNGSGGSLVNISNSGSNRNGIDVVGGGYVGVGYYNGSSYQGFNSYAAVSGWNFVVLTVQNGTVFGYLNGAVMTTSGMSGLGTNSAFGYNQNFGYFKGLIDDVRVYNRALSAAEIQAMYNGGK
jgi:hypothetical protein